MSGEITGKSPSDIDQCQTPLMEILSGVAAVFGEVPAELDLVGVDELPLHQKK